MGTDMSNQARTVDITPVGMQTPEGAKNVQRTMDEWHRMKAELANEASTLIHTAGDMSAVEVREALLELQPLADKMAAAQEAFLRAVAGR